MINVLNLLKNYRSNIQLFDKGILVRDSVVYRILKILKICVCQEVMPFLADTKFPVAKHISCDPGENVSFQSNIRTHINYNTVDILKYISSRLTQK